jgi:uncharacterized protein (UPF0335 family)
MSIGSPVSPDRLKNFFDRIERLEEERKAIGGDIRDVYAEAKGVGYNPTIMRKVVMLRRMDEADRDEQQNLIDTYMHALESIDRAEARIANGESMRGAAKAEGIPSSTLHRKVSRNGEKSGNGTPPHDPETADLRDALNLAPDSAPVNAGGNTPPAEAPETATKSSKHGVFDLPAKCEAPGPQDNPEIGAEASIVVAEADSSGPPTPLPPSEAAIGRRPSPKPISDEQAMDAMLAAHARLQASKRERECV